MTQNPALTIDLRNITEWHIPAYLSMRHDTARYRIIYGGSGTGKSFFLARDIVEKLLSRPDKNFLCIVKTANILRRTVFSEIYSVLLLWDLMDIVEINKTEMVITGPEGNQVLFAGCDDPEKLKSIRAKTGTITDVWIEEATSITENDFDEIDRRVRGQGGRPHQITLTFNPINHMHWIKRRFFDVVRDNVIIHHTKYSDNVYLNKEYTQILEDSKARNPLYYQVYVLGQWGVPTNIIFTNWVIEKVQYGLWDYDDISYGLDFGYNNPSALVGVGFKDGDVYVFQEFYQSKLTNTDLIQAIRPLLKDRPAVIYADAAEPDRISEMNQAGINAVSCTKGKGSVKDGIDFLKSRKIHIDESCVNLWKEIQGYEYKTDRSGNVLDDPIQGIGDHAIDGLRYACEKWRLNIPVENIRLEDIIRGKRKTA